MKEPVFKLAKKGRNVNSENPEDFTINSKFNTLKIVKQDSGSVKFWYTSAGDNNTSEKFTVRHGLGYQPFVLGYYNCWADPDSAPGTRLTIPRWYMMNSRSSSATAADSICGAYEYNSYDDAGTPSGVNGDNEDLNEITFQIYTYHPPASYWSSSGLAEMLISWKYFIFADPQDEAWFI